MQIEFTEEMLDAIEAVKGVRDPQMWAPNCKRYMESQQNLKKDVKKAEKS